jgi:hypothetical protein
MQKGVKTIKIPGSFNRHGPPPPAQVPSIKEVKLPNTINRHAPPPPNPNPYAIDTTKVDHLNHDAVSDLSYTEPATHGIDLTVHAPDPNFNPQDHVSNAPHLEGLQAILLGNEPQTQVQITSAKTTDNVLVIGHQEAKTNIPAKEKMKLSYNTHTDPANPVPIPGTLAEQFQTTSYVDDSYKDKREFGNRGADPNPSVSSHDPIHSVGAGYSDGQIKVKVTHKAEESKYEFINDIAAISLITILILGIALGLGALSRFIFKA